MSNSTAASARAFHEHVCNQQQALAILRAGELVTDYGWREMFPGSRIAPVIDKLRNAWGLEIVGCGTSRDPYRMADVYQFPQLVEVSKGLKESYYETEHWRTTRQMRLAMDRNRCTVCHIQDALVVHHIVYRLFSERIEELITVCEPHHSLLHLRSGLKFPSGMLPAHAIACGWDGQFPDWLIPPRRETRF